MSTPIDFAIITALNIERDAVLRRLEKYDRIEEPSDPYVYYHGKLPIVGTFESYEIVVIRLLEPGNVNSGVETTELLKRWRPQYVLLVGIAGGFPEKDVQKGDVLIANCVYYYEPGKVRPVKGHANNIMQKLGALSRTDVAIAALRKGLIKM